jgi:hypothetical protein
METKLLFDGSPITFKVRFTTIYALWNLFLPRAGTGIEWQGFDYQR